MMSKRARQYISILFAIIAYYIVHEGAHLIVALHYMHLRKLILWVLEYRLIYIGID